MSWEVLLNEVIVGVMVVKDYLGRVYRVGLVF